MKSTVAYYLIILYSIAVCKPVLPIVTDFLGHTFWSQKHITTVHNENGKDHLHYELLDAKDDGENSSSPNIKSTDPVSVHISFEEGILSTHNIPVSHRKSIQKVYLPFPVIEMLLPPPRV